ncbi:FG-GAP-like repeat-containing protein [Streptomyces sp. SID3343]|uniref:FG-GAP-like repeat-containing protein n=1 Tax=Streptomyces sp. SID3343 TaxID=2690260 RepID=UPI001367B97B|nr:hypothetical protein [Streptomyces sp. SID3343]
MRPARLVRCLVALLVGLAALFVAPGPVQAVGLDPGTAPSVRVVSYNVCGGYIDGCRSTLDRTRWAQASVAAMSDWDPDAVLLQELCKGQLDLLAERMPGYRTVWLETRAQDYGCDKWVTGSGNTPSGVGMLVKGAVSQSYSHVFPTADPARASDPTADHYALLCAQTPVDGRGALVCVTHLDGTLKHQGAPVVVNRIRTWGQGLPVVLGGDFNADPQDPNMGRFYATQGGTGELVEADESDRDRFTPNCAGRTRCRSGAPTAGRHAAPPAGGITTATRKFDYVFGSSAYFDPAVGDTVDVVRDGNSLSDHLMYRAAFGWSDDGQSPSAPVVDSAARPLVPVNDWVDAVDGTSGDLTGDGLDDVILRSAAGTVEVRAGNGLGGFADPVQLRSADQAWWDARSISAGDFTGDGRDDLLVRWAAGSVYLYPGNGSGGLGGSIPVLPAGSWSDAVDVTAGDFTGDGMDDVVVRWDTGRVTLHPAVAGAGFAAPIELRPPGTGGWRDAAAVTAGDFDNDGRADLLVRWTAGSVYLYPGDGQGGLGGSIPRPAYAWVDVRDTIAGDFVGDGTDDVLVGWRDRHVDLFAGGGPTGFGSPSRVEPAGAGGLLDAVDLTAADFTGDGVDDVVLRWNAGSVYLYPGDGLGGLAAAVPLVGGAPGWQDARSITAGDFTGDGRADLLVRWTAGSVYVYPGDGHGGIGGSIPVLPAGSWGGAVDVTAGDFTGDGRADVVVRWDTGRVTLHRAVGAPGFAAPVELRPAGAGGWGDAVDVTASDFDHDGRADLLVRWTAGSVYLYPGDGQGGIGGSVSKQPAGAWSDVVDVVAGRFTAGGAGEVLLRWGDGFAQVRADVGATAAPVDVLTVRAFDDRRRVAYFEYTVDAPPTAATAIRLDARHNSVTFRPRTGSVGAHTLFVVAVDAAGNRSAVTSRGFTVSSAATAG